MNKLLPLLLLASASLAGAQAQSYETPYGAGSLHLDACVPDQGQVRCDFTFTPDTDNDVYFRVSDLGVVNANGERVQASKVRVMTDDWVTDYTRTINFVRGVPFKVSYLVNANPNAPLRMLLVNDGRFQNVPVRGAAAPATVSTKANTTTVTTSGYVITLTNCVKSGNDLKCSATMSPK